MVVGLHTRRQNGGELELLLGPKRTGVVAGLLMPSGGHIDSGDLGPLTACMRESGEETGLRPIFGHKVAELRVRVEGKRKKRTVHVFLFTQWTGRLKRGKSREFKWLKFFPYSEIPWDQMPPLEKYWFDQVLIKRMKRIVRIRCGKNRRDVLRITTIPLK